MADKDLKNFSDGTPRDASNMGSNSPPAHLWPFASVFLAWHVLAVLTPPTARTRPGLLP